MDIRSHDGTLYSRGWPRPLYYIHSCCCHTSFQFFRICIEGLSFLFTSHTCFRTCLVNLRRCVFIFYNLPLTTCLNTDNSKIILGKLNGYYTNYKPPNLYSLSTTIPNCRAILISIEQKALVKVLINTQILEKWIAKYDRDNLRLIEFPTALADKT